MAQELVSEEQFGGPIQALADITDKATHIEDPTARAIIKAHLQELRDQILNNDVNGILKSCHIIYEQTQKIKEKIWNSLKFNDVCPPRSEQNEFYDEPKQTKFNLIHELFQSATPKEIALRKLLMKLSQQILKDIDPVYTCRRIEQLPQKRALFHRLLANGICRSQFPVSIQLPHTPQSIANRRGRKIKQKPISPPQQPLNIHISGPGQYRRPRGRAISNLSPQSHLTAGPSKPDQKMVAMAEDVTDMVLEEMLLFISPHPKTADMMKKVAIHSEHVLDDFFEDVMRLISNSVPPADTHFIGFVQKAKKFMNEMFQQIHLYAANKPNKKKIKPSALINHINEGQDVMNKFFERINDFILTPQPEPAVHSISSLSQSVTSETGSVGSSYPMKEEPTGPKVARYDAYGDYMDDLYGYKEYQQFDNYGDYGRISEANWFDANDYYYNEYGVHDDGMDYYTLRRNGGYGHRYGQRGRRKLVEFEQDEGFEQDMNLSSCLLTAGLCIGVMILLCVIGGIVYRRYKRKASSKVKMSVMDGVVVQRDEESMGSSIQ